MQVEMRERARRNQRCRKIAGGRGAWHSGGQQRESGERSRGSGAFPGEGGGGGRDRCPPPVVRGRSAPVRTLRPRAAPPGPARL